MIVEDINGRPIKIGDLVRQVLYDNGAPISDAHRREPKRVEAIGTKRYQMWLLERSSGRPVASSKR